MKKPDIEERKINAIERVSRSIDSLSFKLERLYEDWKYPVKTMAEHMQPEWDKQEESNRFEKQLKTLERQNQILIKTVIVAVVGILVTAAVGVIDIILRIFLNK